MNQLNSIFQKICADVTAPWALARRQRAFSSLDFRQANAVLQQLNWAENEDGSTPPASEEYDAVIHNLRHQLKLQGVVFDDLASSQTDASCVWQPYLGQLSGEYADPYLDFNEAFWRSGTLIMVPPEVSCTMPLQAIRNPWTASLDRQLIIVRSGAELEFISGCVSEATPTSGALTIPVVEIYVERGGHLTYVELENLATAQEHRGITLIRVEEGAQLDVCSAHLGKTLYARQPLVIAADEARVSGHWVEVGQTMEKLNCGISIQGKPETDLHYYAIEKGARVKFEEHPEPTSLAVFSLPEAGAGMESEQLDAMLAAFPLEYAAEIQTVLA